MTKTRRAMIELLRSAKSPLTAQEIRQELQERNLSPDKATVYRQIDFLIDTGIIREVRLKEDVRRFEYAANNEHIHHLICNNCDTVINIQLKEDLEHIEDQIQHEKGFKVQQHTLEFYGICDNCESSLKQ